MVLSGVGFTVFLALAKQLGEGYGPGFLAFWRAFIALIVTLPLIAMQGRRALQTNRFGSVFARSLGGTLGFLLSLWALTPQFGLPLSQFTAISFSRTLFVVVMAALILREPVGPRRWIATGVGFLGVLLMVQPGAGVSMGSWLALGSAASMGFAIIMVKSLAATHSSLSLLTWANLLSSILILPFALMDWGAPSLMDWGLIVAMALAGMLAQFCYITAMRIGDASFQAPMDYLRLPMTSVADAVIFRVLPGLWIWVGAAVIVSSTLYITLREAFLNRDKPGKSVAGP